MNIRTGEWLSLPPVDRFMLIWNKAAENHKGEESK
jgi:hypothetical protein